MLRTSLRHVATMKYEFKPRSRATGNYKAYCYCYCILDVTSVDKGNNLWGEHATICNIVEQKYPTGIKRPHQWAAPRLKS
jgi:hypothetical protein